jgi:hypothetical protein
MDEAARRALVITPMSSASARTVDISTTGARTGRVRRIEIWFYRVDGEIYLTTQPARRSWYVNLLADPEFTFHLKNGVRADLAASAAPVLDPDERHHIFSAIVDDLNQPLQPVADWVSGSPLMHVTFD